MAKLTIAIATILLTGCASSGQWRTLSIDGGSETAFNESLTKLHDELPPTRSRIFSLALGDIVSTLAAASETDDQDFTAQDVRSVLDGLTYEGVIALADQSGPSIERVYHSRGWAQAERAARRQFDYVLSEQARGTQQASQMQQAGTWNP